MSGVGAWIRYGQPVTPNEIEFAVHHYRIAILQPWELDAAAELKSRRPDMTVLCYKCLSSSRDYEPGPRYSSGVAYREAEDAGGHWFATRLDGRRIEWKGYAGHWQMNVLDDEYRARWVDNVTSELDDSPFDGVMADNDVFGDYYALDLPIRCAASMADMRRGLDTLIHNAGRSLNDIGKLLVPNIAESRCQPGRWAAHAAYGGGLEEMWLGWGPTNLFDPVTTESQLGVASGPGVCILRVPTDGNDDHPNFRYGLAASWIFGAGKACYTATAHDDYNRTQHIPELDWQLGAPKEEPQGHEHVWCREFAGGWAAVNFNQDGRRRRRLRVPPGLEDTTGRPAPSHLILPPRRGVVYRRDMNVVAYPNLENF